ncbi:pre-B-cell leukemia homeobox interacting protein 1b isoform 2-T3 [Lycodopsis pacificus]
MSGGSSANSWTILAPEETVAETLRPLAEGTERHGESLTSAAGSGENQPANCAESADGRPVQGHLVPEETTAELSADTSTEQHAVTDASAPASSEGSDSVVAGSDALVQSEGRPEGPALSGPDPDSFADSYAHVSPSSPDEPSASLLSTETLGGEEFTQEEESLTQEGTLHPLNGAELQQEGEGSDLFPKTTDLWKQADSLVGEGTTEETGEEAEPELRRRRSLLAALERIGRTEEEEEGEEEFQLPRQEDDNSGFSVNKCILGAVILLGLGTIFLSESDYGTMELKDAEAPGKQEWLHPEVPPLPVDADSSELLNTLANGNEPIAVLQAQLQQEELKVAQLQAEEGAKEQLRWEEMEKENSRLKKEMASLPVLQKENERMKRELDVVPALQKEVETLRSTVTEMKLPSAASEAAQAAVKPVTSPSSGQPENSTQGSAGSTERQPKKPRDDQREKRKDVKKDTIDMADKEWKERDASEWKEGEKRERKDGGQTEWRQGKHEQRKFDKEVKQKRHGDETEQWREKEGKKEKASRGDEGKQWMDKEGKKEWIEKSERKGRKEEKDWKKASHENGKEGKQWRGKEEKKDWKVGEDRGGKHREAWKKGKDGFEESGKEKLEKKDWKEQGKKKGDWKSKDGKDRSKEGKGKGERKQWEENKNHGKERKGKNEKKSKNGKDDEAWRMKDERKQREKKEEPWKSGGERDKKHSGDWKKDKSSSQNHKEEHKSKVGHGHKEEHLWGDGKLPHTHGRPSLEQPEYWVQQRQRLQHNPKPPQQCDSLETCAQTEGLLPVPFPEFEAILLTYLARAEEAGVDDSKREELKKLAAEFFRDGVFVHDQTSFQEFVDDLGDILEDMVEGDEEEDSAIEEEMEEFEREVMKKFSVPAAVETEERSKAEWRKESGRGRG